MLYSTLEQASLEPQADGSLPQIIYEIEDEENGRLFTPQHDNVMDAAMRHGRWKDSRYVRVSSTNLR